MVFPFFDDSNRFKKDSVETPRESGSFIYVSSEATHKNHINLLDALSLSASKRLFPKLIITLKWGV
jgi:hypothetical protein